MVWQDEQVNELVQKAKDILRELISKRIEAEVYICTFNELKSTLENELQETVSENELKYIMRRIEYIDGRYFKKKNEIWLVNDRGVNLDTILHELIHSIQECSENREGIVYYVTYKLTKNKEHINDYLLKDWEEIEKIHGMKKIISRILKEGDCEEFE